ncbi:ribonuclease P protein component [Enterococcus sp. BWB1-3]|uniref:ribonuclease P protein component n=1 Tax=unclassified Enterococcus TaxID=2608891 RepID=UPI001922ACA9|nr:MULTISPECIES: ribonuclease P protein component [unclassified Enterococcus]MBL1229329.1 ribonuclease P protein component [Enterococcus sp. BWB1-3]MCB5951256.1 ribonuclease P protein component [Enterococcus sp. BWT-B8]MCB5954800.1 ribonuclease P protein component [Enterococcus sp. CWB-B31]
MKKSYRVKKEKEFQRVFLSKDSYANRRFVVYILKREQKHFRVGISVGKKIGNAVTRNAVKRKIRASIYTLKDQIDESYDFIIIARQGVQDLTSEEVMTNLKHVLNLAKILK